MIERDYELVIEIYSCITKVEVEIIPEIYIKEFPSAIMENELK